ncbi:unnamed protein product [Fusarium venenatum]|uniref:Uncharacterized protein n=1 Tax=Fusarium venenatum TaxID=56646 RepID=A0A2L2TDA6_9HYPO|nr:uncharacterized protein FVRRES_07847 [Fusarium venenatum]CEI63411.1 unnamed protein product [Fusarium venenatum]
MSANRIAKAKKKSTENRHALLTTISSLGVRIMPCLNCMSHSLTDQCILNPEKSNCCEPYAKAGYSCDGHGLSLSAARKLADKKCQLERDKEAAEEELIRLQAESSRIHNKMNAQFSKITRLRRQRR